MFNWFKEKGENTRVTLCTNNLKIAFESFDKNRLGMIVVMSQLLRSNFYEDEGFAKALNNPSDISRKELLSYYEVLENIRNKTEYQARTNRNNLHKIGLEMPSSITEHSENTCHALRILMSTLGAGIALKQEGSVRVLWAQIAKLMPNTRSSITQLRGVEKLMQKTTGNNSAMFHIDDSTWESLCYFVPRQFS